MYPKEDINATRPIFLHLAESLIKCVAHLEALFPIHIQRAGLPQGAPTGKVRGEQLPPFTTDLLHRDFHLKFSNILVSRDAFRIDHPSAFRGWHGAKRGVCGDRMKNM
jgi:hypothetical protein